MNSNTWYVAIAAFHTLGDYKDSKVLLQKAVDRQRQQWASQAANAEKRKQDIAKDIHRLTLELGQVHGIFSGGKRRELEGKIEALRREEIAM